MAWQWFRHTQGDSAFHALLDAATAAPVPAPMQPADPARFNTLFGSATFQRGPAVLVLLAHEIGEPAFAAALRSYVPHIVESKGVLDCLTAPRTARGAIPTAAVGWRYVAPDRLGVHALWPERK